MARYKPRQYLSLSRVDKLMFDAGMPWQSLTPRAVRYLDYTRDRELTTIISAQSQDKVVKKILADVTAYIPGVIAINSEDTNDASWSVISQIVRQAVKTERSVGVFCVEQIKQHDYKQAMPSVIVLHTLTETCPADVLRGFINTYDSSLILINTSVEGDNIERVIRTTLRTRIEFLINTALEEN
jgi:hypothetical protein